MKIATQTVSIWENSIKYKFHALATQQNNYIYKYATQKWYFLRDNLTF
jgi:hypothetical protein